MKLIDHKKPDQMKDFTVPFYLGNFLHCSSSIAKELMAEAAIVLKESGWINEFIIYYYDDRQNIRLYLRMAYVAAFHIDGIWEDIKQRLPRIIPLLKVTIELRKEREIGLLWIEKDVKKIQWAKPDAPCLFCDTYRSDQNLQ